MEKSKIKDLSNDIKNELFQLYISCTEDRKLNKYDAINENLTLLGLYGESNEILTKYEAIIMDKFKLKEHMNIIMIMKTDEYINYKITLSGINSYTIKTFDDIYHKIKIIRQLEEEFKLNKLDVGFNSDEVINIDDNKWI